MESTAKKITTITNISTQTQIVSQKTDKITKIVEYIPEYNRYKKGESWHLINLENFENDIRTDERHKYFQRQRELRKSKIAKKQQKIENFKKSIPFRLFGVGVVIVSLLPLLFASPNETIDGTYLLLTIPICLIAIFLKSDFIVKSENRVKTKWKIQ